MLQFACYIVGLLMIVGGVLSSNSAAAAFAGVGSGLLLLAVSSILQSLEYIQTSMVQMGSALERIEAQGSTTSQEN